MRKIRITLILDPDMIMRIRRAQADMVRIERRSVSMNEVIRRVLEERL